VQVEIPLADSWADAQEVARVQEDTGLMCRVGTHRPVQPVAQCIHRRIQAGELAIQQMDVQTYFSGAPT
jgi:2-hydroxy-4-carboxymuconate semialdehyde hemiacetal dehydrogenase